MKTNKYEKRFYRDWSRQKDLHLTHIVAKETDLQILTDKKLDRDFIEERIRQYRWDIENYINRDRKFLTALKPLGVELTAPAIIKEMAKCAKEANVGPMATVAGAIAEFLGKDLLKKSYKNIIIENGGDIFLKTTRLRKIGIYAGKSKLWNGLCLKINPGASPVGICTSSGTIGHSLSFGIADAVIILSKSAILSDAIATATANRIKSKLYLQEALNFARSIKGVHGVVIILRNKLMSWGKIVFSRR